MKKFPIIAHSYKRIIIAWWAICISLLLFFTHLRPSIQFTGWLELVAQDILTQTSVEQIELDLASAWYETLQVTLWKKDGLDSMLVQWRLWSNEEVAILTDFVQQSMIENGDISSKNDVVELSIIWPSIWDNITRSSRLAIIWGTILMAFYILFSFAWMRKVISPILLALVTIVTMIFDVSIASGAYGLLMMLNDAVQVDTIFIIALLTVMWYSINDTIIIFDRIRENALNIIWDDEEEESIVQDMNFRRNTKKTKKSKAHVEFDRESVFEKSLRQTMNRSLATSFSTILVVAAMYIFGTWILKMFAFTLGVWVLAGTYSSIFVAAPLTYVISKHMQKTEERNVN